MIRVACVGAGYFSQFHYDSWGRMPGVTPVAACDVELNRAAATGLPAFDDLEVMLASTSPDVVDLIVPPTAQTDALHMVLAAGVKTVICQKPFGRDATEAATMVARAHAAGTTLVVHENFRFQPWYRAIKAEIDEGRIGQVYQATMRMRPGDGRGPEAYLNRQPYFQKMPRFLVRETAVHWIDTFRYLLGDPVSVYADLHRLNPVIAGEDAGLILFEHANGARSVFDGNRLSDHLAENTRLTMGEAWVEGTSGTLMLRGDGSLGFRAFRDSTERKVLSPNNRSGFAGDSVHAFQSHVVAHLETGAALETEAQSYLDVLRIEEAVYQSADEGRKVVL